MSAILKKIVSMFAFAIVLATVLYMIGSRIKGSFDKVDGFPIGIG